MRKCYRILTVIFLCWRKSMAAYLGYLLMSTLPNNYGNYWTSSYTVYSYVSVRKKTFCLKLYKLCFNHTVLSANYYIWSGNVSKESGLNINRAQKVTLSGWSQRVWQLYERTLFVRETFALKFRGKKLHWMQTHKAKYLATFVIRDSKSQIKVSLLRFMNKNADTAENVLGLTNYLAKIILHLTDVLSALTLDFRLECQQNKEFDDMKQLIANSEHFHTMTKRSDNWAHSSSSQITVCLCAVGYRKQHFLEVKQIY